MHFCSTYEKGVPMKDRKSVLNLTVSGLCLAIAYLLPFLTGQVPKIGAMLLPMHLPVLLCGFVCGWQWGLAVGFVAPLFRSLTLGKPVFFPAAVCMAFELATYGIIAGLMHGILPKKKPYIYLSLLISMIVGRIVWGAAMVACTVVGGGSFTFTAFVTGAFATSIPGIIIQFILIPILVMFIESKKALKSND